MRPIRGGRVWRKEDALGSVCILLENRGALGADKMASDGL
jgi:hypothetical protein